MIEREHGRESVLTNAKTDAAEAVLRDNPGIYRLLVDAVADYGIFALDREGYIMTWNTGAERLKGYGANEVIGTHFSRFYLASDILRKHPEFELEHATREGRYEEEAWRLRKDGSRFWANVLITKVVDDAGAHVGFTKVTRDLTDRKIAEEHLRASEERMRLMIEGVHDYAIFMLDPRGIVTTWNGGALRITGYRADEIIGRPYRLFYPPADLKDGRPLRDLEHALAHGRIESEGWRQRKDGTQYWAKVILTPVYARNDLLLGFSSVTRDLTELRVAEDCVRRAHEDLERRIEERTAELAHAVRARDEFVSIASHELKTPLTSMKLAAQMRLRYLDRGQLDRFAPEKIREMMSGDEQQINRLTRLVDDMLDLSRLNLNKFAIRSERCDLSQTLDALIPRVREAHRGDARVTLVSNVTAAGPWDSFRIEQVLTNLISNALRYGGGHPVEVRVEVTDAHAHVHVRDFGPGVAAADRERIFLAFERAVSPNEVSGLGLGLFISRQIAEAHGGSLHLNGDADPGTTFTLTLPLGEGTTP